MYIRFLGSACVVLLLVAAAIAQESYDQLLHHWDYDKSAPLNIKQAGIEERDGVAIHNISFSSPVSERRTAIGPNGGTVTAYLIVPQGQGPFPAVIFGHWCMPGSEKKNRTEFLDEAIVLAHSGVISLLPDHVIARKDVDPKRLAYVGHSCDGSAGGFLSGVEKRFKAFVIMAGDISFDIDRKTKSFQEYRQKIGADKFDAFAAKYAWMDGGKYVSHAAPAAMFLQYATNEPFLNGELAKQYFEIVSEPKKLKIYDAPHALNAEATRDRIVFLAEQLSFKPPDAKAIAAIPALVQPPWPRPPQ